MMRSTLRVALFALVTAGSGCDNSATTSPKPDPSIPEGLWTVSGASASIIRFDAAQLGGTGDIVPATVVTTPSARLFTLAGVAFDSSGTLWIASADDSLLLALDRAALASGFSVATTVIEPVAGSLSAPGGLAFDRARRLWVANHENGTLVRFDVSQLSAGGPQQPAVVISGLGHPTAIAFDAAGTLWMSDNLEHTIAGFSSTQLETSGTPAPAVVLSSTAGSLIHPSGLAFDQQGNLWVANLGNHNVIGFDADQLCCTGAPVPRRVLAPRATPLGVPVGLAFDAAGNLWVVGGTGTLTRFDRSSLDAAGSNEPGVQFAVTGHSLLWSAAFWPKPVGLPLN